MSFQATRAAVLGESVHADSGQHAVEGAREQASDEFEAAMRLFKFRKEAPVRPASVTDSEFSPPAPSMAIPRTPNRQNLKDRKSFVATLSAGRMAASSFSFGVMGLVGLMTIGMTMPAEALPHEHPTVSSAVPAGDVSDPTPAEIQAYVTPAEVESVDLARSESYSVGSLVNLAGTIGISNFSNEVFTNDQTCSIQWPYAVGVPMSYGFGVRDGGTHEGIDFTPGAGAQIQAIADGVVRTSTDNGDAFGVTIVIDHVVNGQQVSSRYAHMEYGSRQVEVGDTVSVGEFIGRTGNTGRSFGAHLHLELLENGASAFDPMPWLRVNASC